MDCAPSFLGVVVHKNDRFIVVARVRFEIACQHLSSIAGAHDEHPGRGWPDNRQPLPENANREPDAAQEDDAEETCQEDDGTRICLPAQEQVEHDITGQGRANARTHYKFEVMKAYVAPEPPLDPEHPEANHIDHAD